ncbi:hypothetical protein HYQ43_18900 [Paracoccus pantotrophus]|uniref:Uncharacterized protein n=2 Tax=Paracoccus TaxID=265 RepID=A0A7H9BXL8_PARPN|nr:hypothetical protein [Paracoccus pantotrophus]QLH16164.1 hypothetical protein HYQ43_18900 [Paracoccus pantotrophus]
MPYRRRDKLDQEAGLALREWMILHCPLLQQCHQSFPGRVFRANNIPYQILELRVQPVERGGARLAFPAEFEGRRISLVPFDHPDDLDFGEAGFSSQLLPLIVNRAGFAGGSNS